MPELPLHVRSTGQEDLDAVMRIYDIGRQFMRAHGNTSQWINGFPQRELIAGDIERGVSYIVADGAGAIHGVFAFIPGSDPTYAAIEGGAWLNDEPYGTIHRIASDGTTRGVFAAAFAFCRTKAKNIRIDTHRDNYVMQNNLITKGFVRCGIIHIEDGSERVAFQYTV